MIRLLALLLLALPVCAELIPPPGREDSRVRTLPYAPDNVIKLVGYAGYSIDIQFADDEFAKPEEIGTGDADSLEIAAVRNFLFIKPLVAKGHTNLTIITNKRHYRFDYQSLPALAKPQEVVYSLRFTYPQDEAARAARTQTTALERAAIAARPRNTDYWYCGSPDIKPLRVYDDGTHTYLSFATNAEFPAFFVKNSDGTEALVNFHVDANDANMIVIHRTARQFIARKGALVGCISQGKSPDKPMRTTNEYQ